MKNLSLSTKRKIAKIVKGTLFYALCAALTLFFVFPVYVMVSRSLMTGVEVQSNYVKFWSSSPSLDAYATALDSGEVTLPDSLEYETEQGRLYPFIQRNKVCVGDGAEVISPNKIGEPFKVTELYDEKGAPIESAPHPSMRFFVRIPFEVRAGDIMRSGDGD